MMRLKDVGTTVCLLIVSLLLAHCIPVDGEQGNLHPIAVPTHGASPTVSTVALKVSNQSTEVVCGVYIARAGTGEWSDNLLGRAIIEPGETAVVEVAPGVYDLRADNCFDVPLAEAAGVSVSASLGWRITTEGSHDD